MVRYAQHAVSSATTAPREAPVVQSVERAAALLRAVASAGGADSTATALAEKVGLNRTTAWRILATLEQQRLVSLDRRTGRYSLGFGLIDLAGQAGGESMVRRAHAVLARIAAKTGETAALAVMRDGDLTYVAEAVAGAIVSVTWQGRPVSLHATSTGKALLAFSGGDEVRELLDLPFGGRLQRFTPSTITSRAALARELTSTRERGYSECRGEFDESAWGVSAPVLDAAGRPVAVISIWGPPERVTAKRFPTLGRLVLAGAEELAGR
ncbi:IclR family transcriptional regulator [Nocardioides silvaticus]|uniref:IclR family transcriptional regulator n=1 Tax=Nocardioides silvaticus TaxID=2201891 RepID=A0A316TIU0_9ACTN|nr:IclR family transcriptional regulator [Nocardioides silvaticus]